MAGDETYIKGLMSIIVLNYNRLEYSTRTITNLINRTTVPHEFIFVDNGSVDGTREFLSSLMNNKTNAKRVRCIFNPSNYGVAGGRNEGLRLVEGEYIITIDDDILVPKNYDKKLIQACDVEQMGITGVSVERKDYPVQVIDGVKLQVKKGNLGGACLCLPRRVFDQVGYFSPDYVYGGEDCDMYHRIMRLGLLNAYIVPKGRHIDENKNEDYVELKKKAHKSGSKPYSRVGANLHEYKKTGEVYTPYRKPQIYTETFDKVIKGEKDE